MSDRDILILDSKLKVSGTNSVANYNLVTAGLSLLSTWEALDFASTNQFYTVETGVNDTVYWDEGAPFSVAVPPGNYTLTTYTAALKILMDAANGSTFTYTEDVTTGVLTVSIAAGTFSWEFGTNTTASGAQLLGLSDTDVGPLASIVGDLIPDFQLHTHILVRLSGDGNQHATSLTSQEYSFILPITTTYGQSMRPMKLVTYQQTVFYANSTSSLTVSLYTEDGLPLVNTPDYVLTIRRTI